MIYVWHTGHEINEKLSRALHAGIPQSILKHTEWADNYFNSTNKHVAVGYGILRGTGDVFKHNEKHNVDYYEVDRGYINPNHYDGYYRISKNGMQAKYRDLDLPSDRLDKLKFKCENWFDPKGRIIVCPPTEYIEDFYGMERGWWVKDIEEYLTRSERSFKTRHKSDAVSLENDLKGASCVITFNSNVAIEATIKSLPVVEGKDSILSGWERDLIHQPTDSEIDKLLRFISYNQFTLEEIRNGTAWKIIQSL